MSSVTAIVEHFRNPTKARLAWLDRIAAGEVQVFLRPRFGVDIWLPVGLDARMDGWLMQEPIRPLWQAHGVRHSVAPVDKLYPMELTTAGEILRAKFASKFAFAYEVSASSGHRFRKLPDGLFEVYEPEEAVWKLDLHDVRQQEPRALAPRCLSCPSRRCPASAVGCRAPSLAKRGGTR